ncbi:type II toxin-antitoxin system VapC family toxin [Tistrella mobilis]|uniref:type II toxin-antitoxin system VapC family toxin n=1 Tax=Tistrella mobilis TaxID=171437 RepID=UPI0035564A17
MTREAGYLLDTNVISETRRRHMDASVWSFLTSTRAEQLYLSVLTIGELRKGISSVARRDVVYAQELASWVTNLEEHYASRLLVVDQAVARQWGDLAVQRSRPIIDTLIAATALVHGLTLVTRNVRDVADTGVELLNPWQTSFTS